MPSTPHWQTSRFRLDLGGPLVMGIVNATPDSFSDGGQHASASAALHHAEQLLADGAHILDIGGESSRPGAPSVVLDDELGRVLPIVREAVRWRVPISVDTCKPEVMHAALEEGADIVNDIWALRRGSATGLTAEQVVARHPACGICLMHMHGEPQTMQAQPIRTESDAVQEVHAFLMARTERLLELGVQPSRLAWDPGIGFGKTVAHNFALLARQSTLVDSGYPLLVGWSRKSSLGAVTGLPIADRLAPSVAAAVLAVDRGARIVRVHDVRQTVAALRVWQAMQDPSAFTSVHGGQKA